MLLRIFDKSPQMCCPHFHSAISAFPFAENLVAIHNAALENLLTAFMMKLPVEPIKDPRKLLEIHQEVLVTNGGEQELVPLPEASTTSASLKKAILGIEKKISVASQGNPS